VNNIIDKIFMNLVIIHHPKIPEEDYLMLFIRENVSVKILHLSQKSQN
jgi:hypothetical protein